MSSHQTQHGNFICLLSMVDIGQNAGSNILLSNDELKLWVNERRVVTQHCACQEVELSGLGSILNYFSPATFILRKSVSVSVSLSL